MGTNKNLGEVKHVDGRLYSVETPVRLGYIYTVICPECGKILEAVPLKEGKNNVICDNCKVVIGYKAKVLVDTNVKDITSQPKNGMLVWKESWRRKKKKYVLRLGKNVVGRKDLDMPSDLEIDDPDVFVSRQSFEIISSQDELKNYRFSLVVKNAKNPLSVNGNQLSVGESVDLYFGDEIRVGGIKLYFKESVQ